MGGDERGGHRASVNDSRTGRIGRDIYPQMYPAEPVDTGGAAMILVNRRIEEGR